MSERDEIAEAIGDAIRGGKDTGSNYVGAWTHKDGMVRIDADVDLRKVADAVIERMRKREPAE